MSFDFAYAGTCFAPILQKFGVTMQMALLSTVLALLVGVLLAAAIETRFPVLGPLSHFVCSFLKGVPVLVFLYLAFNSLPDGLIAAGLSYDRRNPPQLLFAVLAFGLAYAPYMADMFVSAYRTVPKGQKEACMAAGFTGFQAMRRIIVPQMVVVAVPIFGNHFVNLLKTTSLAYLVNMVEMMGAAKNYATGFQMFLETYIVAALIYWGICIAFDQLFAVLERRLGKFRERKAAVKKPGVLTAVLGAGR